MTYEELADSLRQHLRAAQAEGLELRQADVIWLGPREWETFLDGLGPPQSEAQISVYAGHPEYTFADIPVRLGGAKTSILIQWRAKP